MIISKIMRFSLAILPVNSLSNDTILDLFKLKAFGDDKLKVDKMMNLF